MKKLFKTIFMSAALAFSAFSATACNNNKKTLTLMPRQVPLKQILLLVKTSVSLEQLLLQQRWLPLVLLKEISQ